MLPDNITTHIIEIKSLMNYIDISNRTKFQVAITFYTQNKTNIDHPLKC